MMATATARRGDPNNKGGPAKRLIKMTMEELEEIELEYHLIAVLDSTESSSLASD
jgi:hypothetical protein